MHKRFRIIAAIALIVSMFPMAVSGSSHGADEPPSEYQDFATDEFERVWERTDYPVEQLEVARTWIWGPGANTGLLQEDYEEADDGYRQVQYTDKSRMEMPWNAVDPDSEWAITQGRLAYELMTGRLQVGDEKFEPHPAATIPVAGDPNDETGPTYDVMGDLMDRDARSGDGDIITETVDRHGNIGEDANLSDYGVTDDHYDEVTGHHVASVFWDFMESTGTISVDGQYQYDQPLFENPLYGVGRPMTDAFWGWVKVANVEQNVLIQCFERRCLTYAPGNPDGWEVESANIGQHYYNWRYHEIDRDAPLDMYELDFDADPSPVPHDERNTYLTATVTDTYGDPVEDKAVTISMVDGFGDDGDVGLREVDGGGYAESMDVTTDSNGEATVIARIRGSIERPFDATMSASVGDTHEQVTVTWMGLAAEYGLEITADPNPVPTDERNSLINATVTDLDGDPVANKDVTISMIEGFGEDGDVGLREVDGGGYAETMTMQTDADGEVEVVARIRGSIERPFDATIQAEAGGIEQQILTQWQGDVPPMGVELSADPVWLDNDGRNSEITAHVVDNEGEPVAGEEVLFTMLDGYGEDGDVGLREVDGGGYAETMTLTTDEDGEATLIARIRGSVDRPFEATIGAGIDGQEQQVTVDWADDQNVPGQAMILEADSVLVAPDERNAELTATVVDYSGDPIANEDVTLSMLEGYGDDDGDVGLREVGEGGYAETLTLQTNNQGEVTILARIRGSIERPFEAVIGAESTTAGQQLTIAWQEAVPDMGLALAAKPNPLDERNSTITATVIDSDGAPIANVDVNFTMIHGYDDVGLRELDGGGYAESLVATTNAEGEAQVLVRIRGGADRPFMAAIGAAVSMDTAQQINVYWIPED